MLHHERVTAPDAAPDRWFFVLHGVFGSSANWRLFTRNLAEARPELGFVLVDLRGHGRSPSMDAPHTLDAAAADVEALVRQLGCDGVLGHSLGGKVALFMHDVEELWLLDSQPGAYEEPSPTMNVLRLLESLPESFDTRETFIAAIERGGESRTVARWLAMSVRRGADGRYRLFLDLAVIRSLLEDHMRRDGWPELERHPRAHVVVAGRSFVWQPGDEERLAALPHATVHRIEDAGHWLHVDAPDALRSLLVAQL